MAKLEALEKEVAKLTKANEALEETLADYEQRSLEAAIRFARYKAALEKIETNDTNWSLDVDANMEFLRTIAREALDES